MFGVRSSSPDSKKCSRPCVALLSIVAMASSFGVVAAVPSTVRAVDPIATVPLGLAETFGILTSAAVGNAAALPETVIRGDVGGGGAITGFPPGLITGTVFTGAAVNPMMADLQVAYDNAAGRPAGRPVRLFPRLSAATSGPASTRRLRRRAPQREGPSPSTPKGTPTPCSSSRLVERSHSGQTPP